jgi:DNA-binding SARP family transcriptional activator
MEFRVLGPLAAWANGVAVPLGPRKQQVVLALLAVNPNRPVAIYELVDEVWPDDPPASAVPNVRGYVNTLRRLLKSASGGHRLDR